MFNLSKKIVILACGILCSAAVAQAAITVPKTQTARPSVIASTTGRLPSVVNMTTSLRTTSTSTSTSTVVSLTDIECIDAYTACIKAADVCGSNFEECTTKTLFFGKKPNCTSTLMQCTSSGVNQLFGTTALTSLANKNSDDEYVYPTDASVLGTIIAAAHINNQYDTQTCVKRYTSCLRKEDVCGPDFELCTSNTEFKKQKLFCESTLARCQDEGKQELFGSTSTDNSPLSDSRLGVMITEGAALAAVNAVSTCYKVADNCIISACSANPYKCKEGSDRDLVNTVETITAADGTVSTVTSTTDLGAVNRSEIQGLIKNSCLDTIGGNKFCYATFLGNGAMPTNSQLKDEDNREDVFSEAYSSRFNTSMKSKIDDLITKFDKRMKQQCQNTIVNCAQRNCGEGSGASCYALAFDQDASVQGVTNSSTLPAIKYGCEAVVNLDNYCQYSGAAFNYSTGVLDFDGTNLFDKLFTAPDDTSVDNPDPVGAVATLNAKLSQSYNQATLNQMKKQCESVAQSCVKSMCGTDYANCYRNRTDIASSIGATNPDGSNQKAGGVLDRAVVIGLCLNTVKSSSACIDHFDAESARRQASDSYSTNSWGDSTSVREGWLGSAQTSYSASNSSVQEYNENGQEMCLATNGSGTLPCGSEGASATASMISYKTYVANEISKEIFQELVYDLEAEAQAKYLAKLTAQQNSCMSSNAGGIMGADNLGSTFLWAKLKSNKVPSDYAIKGLTTKQFVASNELYGSFCRIRITLQSDDRKIQNAITTGGKMKDYATAYFAAGDSFTCGAWIPEEALEEISDSIADEKVNSTKAKRNLTWLTAAGALATGIGGGYLNDLLMKKTGWGGLTSVQNKGLVSNNDQKEYTNAQKCVTDMKGYIDKTNTGGEYYPHDYTGSYPASAVYYTTESDAGSNVTPISGAAAKQNMTATRDQCQARVNQLMQSGVRTTDEKKLVGSNVAAGVVSGVVGGVVTYYTAKSIQRSIADADGQEWLDNVGTHIKCYIGSEEVGEFGDMIATEMD